MFRVMDQEVRRKLLEGATDVLKVATPRLEERFCPNCNTEMVGQRPKKLEGVVPAFDFKCPKCGTLLLGRSGLIVR